MVSFPLLASEDSLLLEHVKVSCIRVRKSVCKDTGAYDVASPGGATMYRGVPEAWRSRVYFVVHLELHITAQGMDEGKGSV